MARVNNAVLLNEHPVDQALLRYFLSSRGIASSSLSPRARLETLTALAPDLVIADARGNHPCATLRQRLPKARIVAVSEDPGAVEGADAVLQRPLDFQRVTSSLRPIVDGVAGGRKVQPWKRVLLVDDDTDVLQVARKVLESAGCAVTCIADSSELLRRRIEEPYDLVLLDVVMPEVDGLQLCYFLRQQCGDDLRICMITAATDPESIKRAARYGADGWLTKPIRSEELLALVGLGERPEPPRKPRASTPVKSAKKAAATRRPHVLVIDDDRDILEYCRAVLAGAGAVVDAIHDPSSFREVLPPGGKYDLVLVDLFMPGMDGIEVLQRFSSDVRNCASRLYVITASDDPALRTLAQRSGADGYLTKPLTRNSLLELLA
ncbi:MAG TPA: response regulator [Myxococcales bacterium]|jgi:CheY-like chemotaxis protein|nr:response regulator [Myxococcales bacterium]